MPDSPLEKWYLIDINKKRIINIVFYTRRQCKKLSPISVNVKKKTKTDRLYKREKIKRKGSEGNDVFLSFVNDSLFTDNT